MYCHLQIRINSINLHVVESGDKGNPTILFLHGFPEYWKAWEKQIEFFKNQGYHVLAPDQRGYNLSDKPKKVADYKIEQLAADIVELIKAVGKTKVYLVGHDWGAVIAWHLAITHPGLIEKLVILNVPHPKVFLKTIISNPRQLLKSWYIFAFQFPWLPEKMIKANNYGMYRGALLKAKNNSITEADLVPYITAWRKKGAVSAMVNWYRASIRYAFDYDKYDGAKVQVPTKIIWGKQDQFLESEMAPKSLEYCTKGELVFLENASHWLAHEEPQQVNELILSFLRK